MLLRRKNKELTAAVDTGDASNGSSTDLAADDIARSLNALADGRFDVAPTGGDPMSEAVRHLTQCLSAQAFGQLRHTVVFSSQASEAMAAVSFVTGDVSETVDNTQTIATAVEELDAAIGQISSVTNNVSEEANQTQRAIESGLASVEAASTGMDQIEATASSAGERAQRMADAFAEIRKILEVIDAIAKQTNLLALNATIEAARAGEAGRGFAVVAGEVKVLANQTAKATEEIRGKIEATNEEVDQMLSAMAETMQAVSNGRNDIGVVRSEVEQAAHRVGHVTGRIGDAASGITEQSAATREVARSIEVIREKTANSLDNARKAVDAVTRSEDIIKEQLTEFQALNLPGAVIEFAKSDHALWKKRLAGMLVGASKLEASELADHHQCRLGKWYDSVSEPAYRNHPAFAALEGPHGRVHKHGRAVAELFARGDRIGALAEYKKMEAASTEVVELLERLSSAP